MEVRGAVGAARVLRLCSSGRSLDRVGSRRIDRREWHRLIVGGGVVVLGLEKQNVFQTTSLRTHHLTNRIHLILEHLPRLWSIVCLLSRLCIQIAVVVVLLIRRVPVRHLSCLHEIRPALAHLIGDLSVLWSVVRVGPDGLRHCDEEHVLALENRCKKRKSYIQMEIISDLLRFQLAPVSGTVFLPTSET